MNGFLSNSALILIYSGLLLAGLVLIGAAILSLLRSFSPGRQTRPVAAPGPLLSRAATYSLGLGAAAFGAVGLLSQLLFHVEPTTGVLVSLAAGLLAGFIALALLVYLPSRGQGEEELLDIDVAGRQANVVIPIPGNGLGEVTLQDGDTVINLGARSATGRPIAAGQTVVIERVNKRVAVVRQA
jgi:hypothetical protein